VGKKLTSNYDIAAYVYGVTGRNVNGVNIDGYYDFVRKNHGDSAVIAVDACLGNKSEIGKIKIGRAGIGAGYAVGKTGKRYGDVGVVGIVGENTADNVMQLLSVKYDLIEDLSGRIARYLAENLNSLAKRRNSV
jgi:putative sporulation protein YyaC